MKPAPSRSRRAPSRAKALLAGGLCLATAGLYCRQFGILGGGSAPTPARSPEEAGVLAESQAIAERETLRPDVQKAGS
jgi:hypothetical protein